MRYIALALILALIGCESPGLAPAATSARFGLVIHPAAATARTDGAPGPVFDGEEWALGSSAVPLRYPVQLAMGVTLDEWFVFFRLDGVDVTMPRVVLQRLETVSHLTVDVGLPGSVQPQQPGSAAVAAKIPPIVVTEDDAYSILVVGGGSTGVHAGPAAVYGTRE